MMPRSHQDHWSHGKEMHWFPQPMGWAHRRQLLGPLGIGVSSFLQFVACSGITARMSLAESSHFHKNPFIYGWCAIPSFLVFHCSSSAPWFCSTWIKRQIPFRWDWDRVMKPDLINWLWERMAGQWWEVTPGKVYFRVNCIRAAGTISLCLLDPGVLLNPWETVLTIFCSSSVALGNGLFY